MIEDERLTEFNSLKIDELIAEKPLESRDSSKLIIIDRRLQTIEHKIFSDIINYFNKGDCLVLNESKVVKNKILYFKNNVLKGDILLIKPLDGYKKWIAISKRIKRNGNYYLNGGALITEIEKKGDYYFFTFDRDIDYNYIDMYGEVPLPPYIIRKRKEKGIPQITPQDEERYQTVYANTDGSIAAPTAGFHFTNNLLKEIENKGVKIVKVLLHISHGTFKMVRGDPSNFIMPGEWCRVSEESAGAINNIKKNGGKIFAVGTSSIRTLEKMSDENGCVISGEGESDIFIKPGYKFKVVDCFITNLHVPDSPPLYMASAFAGRELLFKAYKEAVEKKYRFYSYGDSMLIL